jgi:hypothetical protein
MIPHPVVPGGKIMLAICSLHEPLSQILELTNSYCNLCLANRKENTTSTAQMFYPCTTFSFIIETTSVEK